MNKRLNLFITKHVPARPVGLCITIEEEKDGSAGFSGAPERILEMLMVGNVSLRAHC